MNRNVIKIFLVGSILGLFFQCHHQKDIQRASPNTLAAHIKKIGMKDLQNGDLIFVGANTKELSGAISRSTKISELVNYDHVGLVEKDGHSFFVLHAAPEGGSQRESIEKFYSTQTKKKNIIAIYRLKNDYQRSIPRAIANAKTMLGKPYNWLYILDDEQLYCSDFIERAFREDEIFELIPMNFKNLKTGEVDDFWIKFYSEKGKKVPQDEPGTNPNQIASSEKLIQIGELIL
ncbi:YiiX/YebB-like N1pC/P60 family cysteine hydrolase [Vaginella massiliensis]|uniref:YiiX/YebB-like N1pC/P60 family cysteine hydrolase n=1 Tax=Vaginella massiliensis TaxID=1816680 RepID=UPI000B1A0BE8|nr:YiiX/YebB-like N1pC/P60 family cysteine hydrolase [Vaginella massiliensis]